MRLVGGRRDAPAPSETTRAAGETKAASLPLAAKLGFVPADDPVSRRPALNLRSSGGNCVRNPTLLR